MPADYETSMAESNGLMSDIPARGPVGRVDF